MFIIDHFTMKHCLLAIVALFIYCTTALSQIDTLFWFAAPDISVGNGEAPVHLNLLTYSQSSTVIISQPANGAFVPINVVIPANSSQTVDLTPFLSSIESPSGNAINNNGLKITSTSPISAYYEVNAVGNKELYTLKGNTALGIEFYTPFQKFWSTSATVPASFSSIEIVATEDNTTVLITPRTAITGHAQNMTFSVVLNAGQTYSARDMNTSAVSSLAGSIVSANKPVAITTFEGALSNGACSDAIGDQLTNSTFIGKEYVIKKGTGNSDRVYILAIQNSTSLTITNSATTSALINWSETYEIALTDDITHIKSSKPIYVIHVSGFDCELSSAQVPNVYCAGTYSTAFTRNNTDSVGVTLYTRTGFENQFLLNGNAGAITAGMFSPVPGSLGNLQVAQVYFDVATVPVNSYNVIENTGDIFGMGLVNGNPSAGASYGYLSTFKSDPFVEAGMTDTVCANVDFPVNGIVGGGSITGNWTGTGYGGFSGPSNQLTNVYVPSTLDVFVSPVKLILTSTGECPSNKDTLFLYVNPQPMVNASADQTVCANNAAAVMNGSISGGANSGVWSTSGTGSFVNNPTELNASYIPSTADLTNSPITLVLTSTNNGSCAAESDTMMLTITQPAVVDAGPDTIFVCGNNATVSLNGSVTGTSTTGKWLTTGNGQFSPNNVTLTGLTYQPTVSDIANGPITLYLESTSNGNCNPVRDSIKIVFTDPPVVDAGVNQLICTNDNAVQLVGQITGATTTGEWTGGAGTYTNSPVDLNAVYTPTAGEISNGNLLLTLTSTGNGGCNAVSDIVQIVFVAPPFSNFTVADGCLEIPTFATNLSLPGYGSITSSEWNFGDGATASTLNATHVYGQAGTYDIELIITNSNGCVDTMVNQVEIFDLPNAAFTYTSDCPNNLITISFTDQSTSADPIDTWFYDFGGQGNSNQANPSQQFNSQGNYIISHIVETINGCKDTAITTIQVNPTPIAGFSFNTNNGLNVGAVFNFVDTSLYGDSYFWNFDNANTSTLQNPSNTYFANGDYLVTQYVYNDLGCYDSTSVWININTVTTEINTLIPNAISPNGDGYNDVWKLEFIDLLFPNATVQIFNQWGQELFNSVGYDVPWDGRFNGEDVPDGNYYYVINLNADNVEQNIFKGALLVLKKAK